VNTKAAKLIDTVFFPVDPAYLECFTVWMDFLRVEKFFALSDAVFPKAEMGLAESGGFQKIGLSRDPFATTTPLNKIIRDAFALVQLPQYTPHAFRTTLIKMANDHCKNGLLFAYPQALQGRSDKGNVRDRLMAKFAISS